jgi:hypothetical protein
MGTVRPPSRHSGRICYKASKAGQRTEVWRTVCRPQEDRQREGQLAVTVVLINSANPVPPAVPPAASLTMRGKRHYLQSQVTPLRIRWNEPCNDPL